MTARSSSPEKAPLSTTAILPNVAQGLWGEKDGENFGAVGIAAAKPQASSLVIVDGRVAGYQLLVAGVLLGIEVYVLDADHDGIQQVAAIAANAQIRSLHIVSYGAPGQIFLGNALLCADNMALYAGALQSWGQQVAGGIVVYGCEVAQGELGQNFVRALAAATGVPVAAAVNKTGHADGGGDWNLAFQTSAFAIDQVFQPAVLATYPGVLDTVASTLVRDVRDRLDSTLASLQENLHNRLLNNVMVNQLFGDRLETNKTINDSLRFLNDVRLKLSTIRPENYTEQQLVTEVNRVLAGSGATLAFNATTGKFKISFNKTLSTQINLDTNFGIQAGLSFKGAINVDAQFKSEIDFTVDAVNGVRLAPGTNKEFEFSLTAQNASSLTGQLGFLELSAADNGANKAIKAQFKLAADLDAAGGLSIAAPTASLDINTKLNLSGGKDFPLFPNFRADLAYSSAQNSLNFGNVEVNVGSVLRSAAPFIDNIKGVVGKFEAPLKFLTTPLPIIDTFGLEYSLLDLAKSPIFQKYAKDVLNLPPINTAFLEAIGQLGGLNQNLNRLSGTGFVNIGNFTTNASALVPSTITTSNFVPSSSFNSTVSQLGSLALDFPIMSNGNLFKLMLGDPNTELVKLTLPGLDVRTGGKLSFPIWPGVQVGFGGEIGAIIPSTSYGFDASGLLKFRNTGNFENIFEGLYIDASNPNRYPGFSLDSKLFMSVSAGINLGFAGIEVGGEAYIRGLLNLGLNDPNNDGKIRLLELKNNANQGFTSLFNVSGSVSAGANLYVELTALFVTKRVDILELGPITLVSFDTKNNNPPPVGLDLGLLTGGTLRLNSGFYAPLRARNKEDREDVFTLTGGANLTLTYQGQLSESFTGVTLVSADGGASNDRLNAAALTIAVDFKGGVGNDELVGGSANDSLSGGDGSDNLRGNAGNDLLMGNLGTDQLEGNDGDDTIYGGGEADRLLGGSGNDSLLGGTGADEVQGGLGNDWIDGGLENDRLQGDDGADTIDGAEGDDLVWGGNHNDVLRGGYGQDTLEGGENEDSLAGGAGNDLLRGDGGNDTLSGDEGNDTLLGGLGNDSLLGGYGNDRLEGNDGVNTLSGGDGQDTLLSDAGADRLLGDAGNDWLEGRAGNDVLDGGSGLDSLYGGTGGDNLAGGGDNDLLYGGYDDDTLSGGTENDTLYGDAGADRLSGDAGDDRLYGDDLFDPLAANNDTLAGGDGNDSLWGGGRDDSLDGGAGVDHLFGEAGQDTLFGGADQDYLYGGLDRDWLDGGDGNDVLNGNFGDDTLLGSTGNDYLTGEADNDDLRGGVGGDTLLGGDGNDTLFGFSEELKMATANGDGNDNLSGGAGDDEIWGSDGNDTLSGGDGNDILFGDDSDNPLVGVTTPGKAGNDSLEGGAGNDTLYGGLGDDTLRAGAGFDRLYGGIGNDVLYGVAAGTRAVDDVEGGAVFVIAPGSGTDTVYNFDKTRDVIFLTGGLSASFVKFETYQEAGVVKTRLIDLDTDQILAIFIGVTAAEVSKRVDEQNVPPDRLEFDSKKPIYAKDETISLVDAQVRDANGAADLEKIDFWLKDGAGVWKDLRDVGLTGVKFGNADWGDFDADGDLDVLVTGYSARLKSDGQNDRAFDLVPITKLYRFDKPSNQFVEVLNLATPRGNFDLVNGLTPPLAQLFDGTVTWADFNGDGRLDILQTGSKNQGGLAIVNIYLQNATTGAFARPIEVALNTEVSKAVKWIDTDGDNKLDLVLGKVIHRLWNSATQNFGASATSYVDVGRTEAYPTSNRKTAWSKNISNPLAGYSLNSYAMRTSLDSQNNVIITGNIYQAVPGQYDAFVTKYDTNGNLRWAKQVSGSGDESVNEAIVDASGNTFLIGTTNGALTGQSHQGGSDVFIAKYDVNGTQVWAQQFGSANYDYSSKTLLDASGNLIVIGGTYGALPGQSWQGSEDISITKYSANGSLLWQKQIGSTDYDYVQSALTDADGNTLLAGYTYGTLPGQTSAGDADIFVAKYDASGNPVWFRQFGFASGTSDFVTNMVLGADGGITIVGRTSANGTDVFVARYDTAGTQVWLKQFGSITTESVHNMVADINGNVIIAGTTNGFINQPNQGSNDLFVTKYDASGNQVWLKQFGSTGYDAFSKMLVDKDGSVILAGVANGALFGTYQGSDDAFIAKYDASGNQLWAKQLGGASNDYIRDVILDNGGNLTVALFVPGDARVIKYDANGNTLWSKAIGITNLSYITSIALDANGAVIVSGTTTDAQENSGAFVTKIGPEVVNSSDFSDYNLDGKPDMLVAGVDELNRSYTKIYRYVSPGNYAVVQDLLGVSGSKAVWIDYDGDGKKNDVLLSGRKDAAGNIVAQIFKYNGTNWTALNPKVIGTDGDRNGQLAPTETLPTAIAMPGTYQGEVGWQEFTVGTQKVKALVMTGFTGETRRTADGRTVPIPVTKIYQLVDPALGTFVDVNIGLSGVANSSIRFRDYDGDGDLDLLVTGEDIFVRPEDQATLAVNGLDGGNSTTTIYRNDSSIDPVTGKPVLRFNNPIFNVNTNDKRWANFNYQIESVGLTAGVYELRGTAADHATAALELVPGHGTASNITNPLNLDGVDDGVTIANNAALQVTGNQTIELWLKPNDFSKTQVVFGKPYNSEGSIQIRTDGTLAYYYGDGGIFSYQEFSSSQKLVAGSWSHIAVVRDFTRQKLVWYINGEKVNETATTFTAAAASTNAVTLGTSAGGGNNLAGQMDEVRLWNTAKTQGQIQAAMNNSLGGSEAGLAGYWNFTLNGAGQVQDLTGRNNHGVLQGGATIGGSSPTLTLAGTTGQNVFVIGNKTGNLYQGYNYIDIRNFNPNLDVIQLHGTQDDYTVSSSFIGGLATVVVTSNNFLDPKRVSLYIVGVSLAAIQLSNNFTEGNIIFADPRRDDSESVRFAVTNRGNASNEVFVANQGFIVEQAILDEARTGNIGALAGGGGNDTLSGSQTLAETLTGGVLVTYIDGGAGDDRLRGSNLSLIDANNISDTILGWEGNDSIEGLLGNNLMDGGTGNDTLRGGDDDDTLIGGQGADLLDGGTSGRDTAVYRQDIGRVNVNLVTGVAIDGFATIDTFVKVSNLSTIENVIGSGYADTILGDSQANQLDGFDGNDSIDGGLGADTLIGGAGNDTLIGGADSDTLVSGGGSDVLRGGAGADTYVVSGAALTLEEAFNALGGNYKTRGKITVKVNGVNQDITWEKFILWADPSRWNGVVQWDRYRAIGLEPDRQLYRQAATDSQRGWLRQSIGGTRIQEDSGLADKLILGIDAPLTTGGLTVGKVGMAQVGNDLIIDVNKDGVAEAKDDVTIVNFFNGNQPGTGNISAIRIAGLEATYYKDTNFTDPVITKIDRNINFNWGTDAPLELGDRADGFGVIWRGVIKSGAAGSYKFRLTTDAADGVPSKTKLFIGSTQVLNDAQGVALNANQEYELRLEYVENTGDAQVRLQWDPGDGIGGGFRDIPEGLLLSPQTVTANDILNTNSKLTPVLLPSRTDLGIKNTKGWQSNASFGDFNRDGNLDFLLVGSDEYGSGIANVYRNTGVFSATDPNAAFGTTIALTQLERFDNAIWGDYNRDGYLDILATGINTFVNPSSRALEKKYQVKVLTYNNLTGTFVEQAVAGLSAEKFTVPIAANWADFDNDGKLDIATTQGNTLKFYYGNGTQRTLVSQVKNSELTFGDINNDGYLDILAAGKTSAATGTIANQQLTNASPVLNDRKYQDFNLATAGLFAGVTFTAGLSYEIELGGDFDTYLQIIDTTKGNAVVLEDDDSGEGLNSKLTFTYQNGYQIRATSYAANTNGQFNLRATQVSKGVEVWKNLGGQGWEEQTSRTVSPFRLNGSETISLADYNKDSFLDILITGGDRTRVYRNTTTPSLITFSEFVGKTTTGNLVAGNSDAERPGRYYISYNISDFVRDVNREEIIDIAVNSSAFDTYLKIVKQNANGSFQTIAFNDDSNGTRNSYLQFKYTPDLKDAKVWVSSYLANTTGAYTIETTGLGLPGVTNGSATWGNFNNDGVLDVALTGEGPDGAFTKVFLGPSSAATTFGQRFQSEAALLPGLQNGTVTWGDYDNDSDLDLLVTGTLGTTGKPFVQIYRNNYFNNGAGTPNVTPLAPTVTAQSAVGNGIQLTWNNATASGGTPVSYNLRIGTTTGGNEVLASMANSTGKRSIAAAGNAGFSLQRTMSNLAKGVTHYWSVQSIGTAFLGSAFSPEKSFTTNPFSTTLGSLVPFGNGAWGDYDRDGDLDYISLGTTATNLYRNTSGILAPVTLALPSATQARWLDYNRDGLLDIALTTASGIKLFAQQSGGTFVASTAVIPSATFSSWADYDNDGDLDLLLNTATASTIYRNTNGTFAAIATTLPGAVYSSWADYDNDGDFDLLLSTATASTIYRNTNGTFAATAQNLLAASHSTWGDFDNDGDLDLLLTDATKTSFYTNNLGVMTLQAGTLAGGSSVAIGDYDGDGKIDVAILSTTGLKLYKGWGNRFEAYLNQQSFVGYNTVTQADYDKDGDLDLFLAGSTAGLNRLILNEATNRNTAPLAPTLAPIANILAAGTPVTLKWNGASDAQTPLAGLTYNLRVGTVPGGNNILSIPVNSQGQPLYGNVGQGKKEVDGSRSWALNGLAPGQYYWSIQAVDNNLSTSAFAPEQTFTVMPTATFLTPTLAVTEGSSGEKKVLLTLRLSQATSREVSIDYNIFAGATDTATPGNDFTARYGTVKFAPNTTTQTIELKIAGDNLPEQAETLTVSLQNFVNAIAVPGQTQAKVTIINESPDLAITQIASPSTVTQRQTLDIGWLVSNLGNGGSNQLPYGSYIYLSTDNQLSNDDQFLGFKLQNLPQAGQTQSLNQSITIPFAGTITAPITRYLIVKANPLQPAGEIDLLNNLLTRKITILPGQFTNLKLTAVTAPAGTTGLLSNVTATVQNLGPVAAKAGWKTQAYWSIDNQLDNSDILLQQTDVTTSTAALAVNGTATFISNLTLPTTATSQGHILFRVVPASTDFDTVSSDNIIARPWTLTFSGQPQVSLTTTAIGLAEDANVVNRTGQNFQYTFKRTGNLTAALTVNFSVSGTALFASDYTQTGATSFTATTGSITFAAGKDTATLTLVPVSDAVAELDEKITLTVTTGTGYTIGVDKTVTSTIINDDAPVNNNFAQGIVLNNANFLAQGTVSIEGANLKATGEVGELAILSDPTLNTVWYFWTATTTGPVTVAINSTNFDPTVGIFTGVAVNGLTRIASDDDSGEGQNSLVRFNTVAGTRYAIAVDGAGANTGNFTLQLTDDRPRLTVEDLTIVERDGVIQAEVNVILSRPLTGTQVITVTYITANGTAIAGQDYTAVAGTLTFSAGETVKKILVPIATDSLKEARETFTFSLSNPSANVKVDRATATITIEDTVKSSITATLAATDANLLLTGTAAINGIGNIGNNILLGNTAGNLLDGGAGNDTLNGGAGNDVLIGRGGNDVLIGGDGIDLLRESGDMDFLLSDTQLLALTTINQQITVNGNDTLSQIETANIVGGNGNNRLDATAFTGSVTLAGGLGNDNLLGGNKNDSLDGGDGNDTLQGGAGNDLLVGGLGVDLVVEVADANFTLTNTQLIGLGTDTLSGIETAHLTGGQGNNVLNATAFTLGNVTLDGGAGNDTMQGGTSNNTYLVDAAGDVVTESSALSTSIDTVQALVSYTLGANLENLVLLGAESLSGTGNNLNNSIRGNAGNNRLTGGLGNDTIDGGTADPSTGDAGIDRVVEVGDVNFTLTNTQLIGLGTDTLIRIDQAQLSGGVGNNTINAAGFTLGDVTLDGGAAGNDHLLGGSGEDLLIGGLGNDTLNGGAGDDTVWETGNVNFVLSGTTLTGNGTDSLVSIEKIHLVGGATANILNVAGFAGDTTLDGGAGSDSLIGGSGSDLYIVDMATDIVTESSTLAASIDTVQSLVTYTLGANLENLTLLGSATINGVGNTANNRLLGNTANNLLDGGAGNDTLNGGIGTDTLVGGLGNDTYIIDIAGDVVIEISTLVTEIDTVRSSITYTLGANVENLVLTGASAINGTGNALNNLIAGNIAANSLTGGAGVDTFVLDIGNDNSSNNTVDTITDFATNERLQVSVALFGGGLTVGTIASTQLLVGAGAIAATTATQRFIFNTTDKSLYFDADGLNGSAAVKVAVLSNLTTLVTTNFSVIA